MNDTLLLDPIRILQGPDRPVRDGAVLLESGVLKGFDQAARERAHQLGVTATQASDQLIAPCLVDPHSVLEAPFSGRAETLDSLRRCAAAAGYGQVALLPRSPTWRDSPERLIGFRDHDPREVTIHLWAGFSRGGSGSELASHGDLLDLGAIGLADDDALIPLPLLERGLLLGEMGSAPVLVAPRDPALQGDGMVREGVETLRAGWSPDPETSETLPLRQLLALHQRHPERQLRLMNVSTAAAVESLRTDPLPPLASVCWWHLLADRGTLLGGDASWRVRPSLGGASDREALRRALADQLIRAVSVHAVPLDAEDMLLPPDQRPPGLSGHHLVLPALWDALVRNGGFSLEQLWQGLSFGPSALIDQPPEELAVGSRRWLLFDPGHTWQVRHDDEAAPMAANLALLNREMQGRVIACGLSR